MRVLDALKALWILGVFLSLFLWLPAHLFSGRAGSPRVIRIAGNGVRMLLCLTIAAFLLCSLRVFGVITVVLFLSGALMVGRYRNHPGMLRHLLTSLQVTTINIIRQIELRSFGLLFLARKRVYNLVRRPWGHHANAWLGVLKGKELLGACFLVALGTTVVLRAEH